jgi:hypothetical protein
MKCRILVVSLWIATIIGPPSEASSFLITDFRAASSAETERLRRDLRYLFPAASELLLAEVSLPSGPMSIVRVKSSDCQADLCPTVFRYTIHKAFEFVLFCKQPVLVLSHPVRLANGELTISVALDAGHQTIEVTPTSIGPVIKVTGERPKP